MTPMLAIGILVALVFAILVPMYRRFLALDEPIRLWGSSWASTAEAADALSQAMGLARERRREGSGWLSSILMAPVWFLWDPMGTDIDSMLRLAPWRLTGARASGRFVRVEFPAGRVQLALRCELDAFFSAKAKRDGKHWRLDEQEGLRLLHPVGGPGWQEGTCLVEAAFAQGADSLRLRDGMLVAEVAIDERGPRPAQYPGLLESLERLAASLEHVRSDAKPATELMKRKIALC